MKPFSRRGFRKSEFIDFKRFTYVFSVSISSLITRCLCKSSPSRTSSSVLELKRAQPRSLRFWETSSELILSGLFSAMGDESPAGSPPSCGSFSWSSRLSSSAERS
eukprot:UN27932